MQLVKYLISYYVPDVEKSWDEYNFIRRRDCLSPHPFQLENWGCKVLWGHDTAQLGTNYFSAVGAWELTLEDGHPSPEWSSEPFLPLTSLVVKWELWCQRWNTLLPCYIEKSTGGWGVGVQWFLSDLVHSPAGYVTGLEPKRLYCSKRGETVKL